MKKITVYVCLFSLLFVMACSTHIHKIGAGAKGGESIEKRQWYALWGLVPINNVDSSEMAGGAANYEIKTEQSPLNIIINFFTGIVTVYSRTVTVTK
ncbi:MAG TPA: hypothetical protein PK189_08405 [bacterium]|nr:hypothetical protein [bacterium]